MNIKIGDDIDGIRIIKYLGRGRGGYSYLVSYHSVAAVLKLMHYEPCEVYDFPSDKLKAEIEDYKTLSELQIPIPKLLFYNTEKQYLIKEYIEGRTCAELIASRELPNYCYKQIIEMCNVLYIKNINIDYMPHNFVLREGTVYYIDYECNQYCSEWDFENWGIYFWANYEGMAKQLETGDHRYLSSEGRPIVNKEIKGRVKLIRKMIEKY